MNLYRIVSSLARWLAILGGVSLIAVTIMTVVSITGRSVLTIAFSETPESLSWLDWLFEPFRVGASWLAATFRVGPVPGDFELVEVGTAFAVFAFLPWCQLNRGHATVDVFTSFFSDRANRVIDLVTEVIMALVMILFAWRLWHGMLDKIRYHETTFILQFPVWWGYAAALVALVGGVVVSLFVVLVRIQELRENRIIVHGQGVVH